MKQLHRPDLWCWSRFDEARNIDFNSYLWCRGSGNVIVDPLPLSDHDRAHLEELGGAAWVVITNSDHVRDSAALATTLGAQLAGPAGERDDFPLACDQWLEDGDELGGLKVVTVDGSKTAGELALYAEDTLITGDLVRSHRGGSLTILPDPKLSDRNAALASVAKLASLEGIEAVLVGDGWPVFRDGAARLADLDRRLRR